MQRADIRASHLSAARSRRGLFISLVLLIVAVAGILALSQQARSAFAAPLCDTWQGWSYCGNVWTHDPPPGMGAESWKQQQHGYTHPCVYASFRVGGTWYPQGDLCAEPYTYFVNVGSSNAECTYAQHWIRDGVSESPRLTSYVCP